MQFDFDMEDRGGLIREVDRRLRRRFVDFRPRYRLLDPVSQLVMSMLGGQTYGHVSKAAHARLVSTYADWSAVRDAQREAIERLIRPVTHWQSKAERIQRALTKFTDASGQPCLDWLADLSVEDGHRRLEEVNGIGPKTAAAVLNTSTLRKRSLVIDSHHLRIVKRLGLLKASAEFNEAYRTIMPLVPIEWSAEAVDWHHILVKYLGQVICRPKEPHCQICPLNDLCPGMSAHISGGLWQHISAPGSHRSIRQSLS